MCDCNDECSIVTTGCCGASLPRCETAEVVDDHGHVDMVMCLIGFGCAADRQKYLDKLLARFG